MTLTYDHDRDDFVTPRVFWYDTYGEMSWFQPYDDEPSEYDGFIAHQGGEEYLRKNVRTLTLRDETLDLDTLCARWCLYEDENGRKYAVRWEYEPNDQYEDNLEGGVWFAIVTPDEED